MAPGKSTKGSGALEQARQEEARALQQRTQKRVAEVKSPAGKPSPVRRAGGAASRPRSSRSSTRTGAGSSKKTAVDAMDVVHDEEEEEEGGDVDEAEDEVVDGENGEDNDEAQHTMDEREEEEEEAEEEEEVVEPPSDTRKRRKSKQASKPSPPKKRRPTETSRGEAPAENVVNHTIVDDNDYMDPRFHNAPAPAPAPAPSEPLFLPVAPNHPPQPRPLNSIWGRPAAWLPNSLWNPSNGGGGGGGGGGRGGAAAARGRGPSSPTKHVAFDDRVTEGPRAIPSGASRPDPGTLRRPFPARPPPPARPMSRPAPAYRQPPPQLPKRELRVMLKHAVRTGLTRAVQGLAIATVVGVMWLAYSVLTRPPCASDQVRKHGLFGECVLDKAKARKVKRAVQRLAVNDICHATEWSAFRDPVGDEQFLRQVNNPAEDLRIDAEAVKSLAIDVGELGPELREWLQDHGVGLAQHSVYLTDRQRVVEAIRSQWALSCGVRLLMLDYALVFLVALLGLAIAGAYMVFRLANAKDRRRVEALKRAAMDVLVNEGDVPPLHVRDGILERLDQLPGMGGATRKHVLKLWPQVARLVEADSRVSTINLESYGRAELHWRWKGRRSLVRPPAVPTNAAGARAYVVT